MAYGNNNDDITVVPCDELTYHGSTLVAPGRGQVIVPGIDWAYTPEECPATAPARWFFGGNMLLCSDCGLDCT